MSFQGMTQRFEQRMNDLYSKYSANGPGHPGLPFSEIKPNDPARFDIAHDTQFSPSGYDQRAWERYKAFIKSPRGQIFMRNQAELQTGNTFSETRLYNPLFPIGRLPQTTFHITRPLATARGTDPSGGDITSGLAAFASGLTTGIITGGNASEMSPGADFMVGGAGRLQKATARTATDNVLHRSGPTGLLNLLPLNKTVIAISAIKNVFELGTLGVNQRPEFDVNGEYFSIAVWTGFTRGQSVASAFTAAGASARKGDITGAISNLAVGISNVVQTTLLPSKGLPVPNSARKGRDDPNRLDLDGLRYFIVNKTDADRYLQNSIENGRSNVEFLNRRPYGLSGESILFTDTQLKTPEVPKNVAQIQKSKQSSFISTVGGFVRSATSALIGGNSIPGTTINIGATNPVSGRLGTDSLTNNSSAQNPAEERMLFGTLSLASRYENASGDVKFFEDGLDAQKTTWMDSVRKLKTEASYGIGYVGGIQPGNPVVDDAGTFAAKRTKIDNGRYFSDAAVNLSAILVNKDNGTNSRSIDADLKSQIREGYSDTIDFMFHDYVNNKVIPFRAMLTQINENIVVDWDIQRYVGRIEKNVVYGGAGRELSFSFFIQAFSKAELDFIWQKINYLTGLCFPADYADGFMIPPFVQLTIGNYYVDQPGYIRVMTNVIDDNTSWDIDADAQISMGITVSIVFSVIEKKQMRTGIDFYGFGTPTELNTVGLANTNTPQTLA